MSTMRRPIPRRWPARLLISLLLVVGALITLWPIGQSASSALQSRSVTRTHAQAAEHAQSSALDDMAEAARAYNAALPPNSIHDPWDADNPENDAAHAQYLSLLDLEGDGIMGSITIPVIGVDLPIRHDADWTSMRHGAAHMYGTSLPIGGEGSHAVIAAHTAWIGATFFDRLPELSEGDSFTLHVLNTELDYEIDQILTVDPEDVDRVAREEGRDLVTLVTCAWGDDGELSKRVLVRGHRVDAADAPVLVSRSVVERVIPGYQPNMRLRLGLGAGALVILSLMWIGWIRTDVHRAHARRQENRP